MHIEVLFTTEMELSNVQSNVALSATADTTREISLAETFWILEKMKDCPLSFFDSITSSPKRFVIYWLKLTKRLQLRKTSNAQLIDKIIQNILYKILIRQFLSHLN